MTKKHEKLKSGILEVMDRIVFKILYKIFEHTPMIDVCLVIHKF